MKRHVNGTATRSVRSNFGFAVVLLVLFSALFAGSAQAKTLYSYSGEFANGGFSTPTDIAVDDGTGNVLVADSGNSRIQVFSPEALGTYLTTIETGSGSVPFGIAIDQASGDLYLSDGGNNQIVRYLSDGAPTPTYTLDPSFTSPAAGSDPGQIGSFSSPLAVDPTSGDLLVADVGNHQVSRYAPNGDFISSFDGAAAGGFHELSDLVVDGDGDVYVVDITSSPLENGSSVLEKFDADGGSLGTLPAETPRSVGYDAKADNVVAGGNQTFPNSPHLYVFNRDLPRADTEFSGGGLSAVPGVAVNGSTSKLYAVTNLVFGFLGVVGVQVFDPVLSPDVTLDVADQATAHTVHVAGTVDPLGSPTTYHFEYSRDGGTTWASSPDADAGEGNGPVPVDAVLTGLTPNSNYLVRLVATNEQGNSNTTDPLSFSTEQSIPDASTGEVSDITATGARLRGAVSAFGLQATYRFEYGLTTDYGSSAPLGPEGLAGVAFEPRQVTQPVTGLQPGTIYHYRLVAKNSLGEATGADRTFTTLARAEARAYELVSPADKGGANVDAFPYFVASPDGNRLTYPTMIPLTGSLSPTSSPVSPKYFAQRGADDWTSVGLDPPQLAESEAPRLYSTLAVSEDGSRALVMSGKALAPGAVEGDSNLYLRDTASGALTTVGTSPGLRFVSYAGYLVVTAPAFVGGTADFSHLLFYALNVNGCCSFLPGAPVGALYDFTGGELKLVSRYPDESPSSAQNEGGQFQHRAHRISADGSRIFFNAGDSALYARIDGVTKPLSVSQRAGDPDTPQPGTLLSASADGRVAYFTSNSQLTDEAPAPGEKLYRVDVDSGQLTMIGDLDTTRMTPPSSDDGSYVYFISHSDLGDGGAPGLSNVYVWHEGVTHRVATLGFGDSVSYYSLSPNGRYFAFATFDKLTSYDPASSACHDYGDPGNACKEIYRYDAVANALSCASCPADGRSPVSNAHIANERPEFSRWFPRVVLDDGRVFFDTGEQLAAGDTNSARDVYSYDGQQATLISAGTGLGDSQFADASSDGRDVFFTTQDRLVGVDTDQAIDVYDARVGGGFASQGARPAPPACSGDGCREGVQAAPPPASAGSEAVRPGNPKPHSKKRCKARHGKQKKARSRCKQRGHTNGRQGR